MDVESRRDLQLLEALEREAAVTQRSLALQLGIALGLTNLYLKRLIRKGYVKCVTVSPRRLAYSLTPRGVARKARLTYEFMKYSLDFYHDARRHLRHSLATVSRQQRIAIYGTGDAAELVFLLLKEMELEVVAVFGEDQRQFLGFPVRSIPDHADVEYDVLIVAVLDRPRAVAKRLMRAGILGDRLLLLHPLATALPDAVDGASPVVGSTPAATNR